MIRKTKRSKDICPKCLRPKMSLRHNGTCVRTGKLNYGSRVCRGLFADA